ncbi:MAG: methyltransferase [Peptococcaceae bacterium BRH_c4b]|nr:MAG: methyltransferase [Peptococcaceae bacterium BRH_c4b]
MAVKTRETVVHLPGKNVSLAVVRDVEELITDPADEDKVPLWAEIWPAARGLSEYIWNGIDFSGQTVLELGAGLGLAGVICGLKGAIVTFSDYQASALEIASMNARKNGLSGVDFFLGDWRDWKLSCQFDWIVGSDILYDPKFHPYLRKIIAANLQPGGSLLFSHPGRKPSFQFVEQWERDYGCIFRHTMVPVNIEDPHFPYYEIHIHHLQGIMELPKK